MKKLLLSVAAVTLSLGASAQMHLQGILDLGLSGSSGKAVHVAVDSAIADLSDFGIGIANNGGGTDGQEYTFPAASAQAGEHILVVRDSAAMAAYFAGCFQIWDHVFIDASGSISQNGDDAVELFYNGAVIETFGDIDVDGSGQPWEYTDSWAYKMDTTWTYGGIACTAGDSLNVSSSCPYPACPAPMALQGILDFTVPVGGSSGKAVHVVTNYAIADLSQYGLGVANNGGGTDGVEYVFPAMGVPANVSILVVRDSLAMADYFGACFAEFDYVFVDAAGGISQNGDDAIELFKDSVNIETFGDVDVDGSGLPWEYTDSWAFKDAAGMWTFGGVNCTDTGTTTFTSPCPYPVCTLVAVDSITVAGANGATAISVKGDSLQMNAMVYPSNASIATVLWSVDDTTLAVINQDGMLYARSNGTVTVTATSTDGSATAGSTTIDITNQNIGLDDLALEALALYPNPASDQLTLRGFDGELEFVVFDLQGKKLLSGQVQEGQTVSVKHLANGTYFMHVSNGSASKTLRLTVAQF